LGSAGQDLVLVDAGSILTPGTETTVASTDSSVPAAQRHAEVTAGDSVLLRIGDNFTSTDASVVRAGHDIDVYGDHENADAVGGTVMDCRGTFPRGGGASDRPAFFGNAFAALFTFNQPFRGGQPYPYGSTTPPPSGAPAPRGDGRDDFVVNQLNSMDFGAR